MALKKTPEKLLPAEFCPGCGHGIVCRLIMESIDELGLDKNHIIVTGVGCSCTASRSLYGDRFQAAHGRAAAVATGMKRYNPNLIVITYQGDGDSGVIGLAETLNAAYRNENITVFTINNTNFGMTGGQMSWTTMPGQKTTTSQSGRDCEITGHPIHLPEIISGQFDVAYVARASVHDVKHINQAKAMVKNAIEAQINGEGYSMVEFVSACPTNWGLTPLKSLERVETELIKEFPVGEFKKREKEAK
jgi:2-oxoglutarate/2-oxoacid ferredoxin oxidoreductase subunit beta